MALYGARSIPFGTLSGTGQFTITGAMRMRGFGVKNTSGSATAEVDIYDGEGSGGQLICAVTLAANESTREWWSGDGISIEHGVAVVWVSGSVSGSIWVLYPYDVDPDDTGLGV
jgi:hypothetical protein